jgi:hypothetical protein
MGEMPATTIKTCQACREQHHFFLPIGSAAELTKRYEYTCPKNQSRVQFSPTKWDLWKRADAKTPGSVIVREVISRA